MYSVVLRKKAEVVVQLLEFFLAFTKPWVPPPEVNNLGIVVKLYWRIRSSGNPR